MTFALLFEFLHTLILHLMSSLRVMMTALHKILMCLWRRVFFFKLRVSVLLHKMLLNCIVGNIFTSLS